MENCGVNDIAVVWRWECILTYWKRRLCHSRSKERGLLEFIENHKITKYWELRRTTENY